LLTEEPDLQDPEVNARTQGVVDEAYKLMRDFITSSFEESIPQFTPLNRWKVVSYKPKHKQAVYKHAAQTLDHRPLTRRDAILKMFVKNERTLDANQKAPRAIQARKPRFNLELQTYLHNIEKWVFKRGDSKRVSSKGLDQYQKASLLRTAWEQFNDPVAILADHGRFDSRQTTQWLKAEHDFYQSFYPGDQYLSWLLSLQITNFGATRNGVRYKVKGTRASGDVNTSLGNSVANIAILCKWLSKIANKRIIVDGDDSVIKIERCDLYKVDATELSSLNFGTTYSVVDEFCMIDFCQCKPINTINGWLMVRAPQRMIERSTTCIESAYTTAELFKRWLYTVGQCEKTCNSGVPVLSAYCDALMTAHTDVISINDDTTKRIIKGKHSDTITSMARITFAHAFGISPLQQIELEKRFHAMNLSCITTESIRDVIDPSLNTSMIQG